MKKNLSLFLAAVLSLSLLSGCGPKQASSTTSSSSTGTSSSTSGSLSSGDSSSSVGYTLPKLMVLSGPTGVGAAKLMADTAYAASNGGKTPDGNWPAIQDDPIVVADNQQITDALVNGQADIAAIATNVAATLDAKSNGLIQVLAVNTLGVLYILEKGDTVHSLADLSGKTVYATGQGANPEYILNYLLEQNGVDPAQVDIQWMTAQEVSAKMASAESGICMLPVPSATALMVQDSQVRQALSLSEIWDTLEKGTLPMGCIVARTDYIQENPQGVEAFLSAYADSIAYMSDSANLEDAAQLVAQYEITPNAAVAKAAIPQCNLAFLTGSDMKLTLENYYQVLFQANPDSIGGGLPYDSFYYGVE
ncbi:MAG: ABC transporter substrate-binding protein [Lawsonibacter sp.]|jgi:NitT/TauT family transport system substrate-binding protein